MGNKKTVVYYSLTYHCPSVDLGHLSQSCGLMWGESKEACDRIVINELLEQRPDAVNISLLSKELPQDKLILLTNYLNQTEVNLPETKIKKGIVA
jgi:hypothetical protein